MFIHRTIIALQSLQSGHNAAIRILAFFDCGTVYLHFIKAGVNSKIQKTLPIAEA